LLCSGGGVASLVVRRGGQSVGIGEFSRKGKRGENGLLAPGWSRKRHSLGIMGGKSRMDGELPLSGIELQKESMRDTPGLMGEHTLATLGGGGRFWKVCASAFGTVETEGASGWRPVGPRSAWFPRAGKSRTGSEQKRM